MKHLLPLFIYPASPEFTPAKYLDPMATPALAAQTSLFVGNLDRRVYRQLLERVFSLAGPVTQCHVVFDKNTGISSGFGFVDYADHTTAQAAMEKS